MLFSFGYELKVKKFGKRLNFKKDLQPQQLPKLKETKDKCVHKKLSDMDMSLKPYDGMNVCGAAYLIVHWYRPRKTSYMYWIDIDKMLYFKSGGEEEKKSISESEAESICLFKYKI